jgi:hypothetical protein
MGKDMFSRGLERQIFSLIFTFKNSALTKWILIGLAVTDLYYQLLITQQFFMQLWREPVL